MAHSGPRGKLRRGRITRAATAGDGLPERAQGGCALPASRGAGVAGLRHRCPAAACHGVRPGQRAPPRGLVPRQGLATSGGNAGTATGYSTQVVHVTSDWSSLCCGPLDEVAWKATTHLGLVSGNAYGEFDLCGLSLQPLMKLPRPYLHSAEHLRQYGDNNPYSAATGSKTCTLCSDCFTI